jgi:hypothetical protein
MVSVLKKHHHITTGKKIGVGGNCGHSLILIKAKVVHSFIEHERLVITYLNVN